MAIKELQALVPEQKNNTITPNSILQVVWLLSLKNTGQRWRTWSTNGGEIVAVFFWGE